MNNTYSLVFGGLEHGTPVAAYETQDLPLPVTAIRYYLPVRIASEGNEAALYHYCCCLYPGYKVWPVGYCSKGCSGHQSKAEAREHYRQFLVDRFGQYTGRLSSPAGCAVCGLSTTFYAWVDFHFEWEVAALCPQHLNHDGLTQAFVFKDYHLLQISDARLSTVATIIGSDGLISVVRPVSPDSRF